MVSVIIPIYNAANYITDTLWSVLASTYSDIEVICMDDGSEDDSLHLVETMAKNDARIKSFHQANAGVCKARNAAIACAKGEYILPVDADNLLGATFIERAVAVMENDKEVKVVCPSAKFFGEREGKWKLPPFSLHLLARKNMMDTCALYRRSDWQRVGGYCEEIIAREDWEFWISMLKDGGKVVRLKGTELKYRIRKGSKRMSDRQYKHHVVDVLNQRHAEFFQRELGGQLRYNRSWSRFINRMTRVFCPHRVVTSPKFVEMQYHLASLPYIFNHTNEGLLIYKGRNELREFLWKGKKVVVKSFCLPHIVNRIVYGTLRSSKAERSFLYATKLRSLGIGSPEPVGFVTVRCGLFFTQSYYVSLRSELPFTYIDLMKGRIKNSSLFLREIGRVAGRMHEAGIIHRDFSRGNLLLGEKDGQPLVEIVDLNRIRFHFISIAEGVNNFSRLPATPEMQKFMAEGYAETRHADINEILRLWPQTESMDSPAAGLRM